MRHRKLFCRYSMLAFYVITKSCNRQSFQAIISSNHFKQSFQAIITCMQGCHQIVDIREFCIQSGKIMGKERCFKKSGKTMEVFSLVLFYFRALNFSILNHTSNWVWQSQISSFWILFCFYAVLMKHCSVFYGNRKVEWPK